MNLLFTMTNNKSRPDTVTTSALKPFFFRTKTRRGDISLNHSLELSQPIQRNTHGVALWHMEAAPTARSDDVASTAIKRPADDTILQIRRQTDLKNGGGRRDRTDDLMLAKQLLSQLSYAPEFLWDPQRKQRSTSQNPCFRSKGTVVAIGVR